MRPGKRDRTVKEWRQRRNADAGQRSVEQLGLHGDDWAGLEPESLVWIAGAQSGTRPRGTGGMEFRRFLQRDPLLPCPGGMRGGRRTTYRILGYNEWLKDFFATWEYLRRMAPA